jgi:hypothetical protein
VYDRGYIYFIDGRWTKLAHFFVSPSKYEARRQQSCFSKRCVDSMGCLNTLTAFGTTHFPIYFGKGYVDWRKEI